MTSECSRDFSGEDPGEHPRLRFPSRVGPRRRTALNTLAASVTAAVDQSGTSRSPRKNATRGVARVLQLRGGSPALRGALLEQADRVAVAAREILELRFLERGCEGNRDCVVRQTFPQTHRRDRLGVLDLGDAEPIVLITDRRRAVPGHSSDRRSRRPGHPRTLTQSARCRTCASVAENGRPVDANGDTHGGAAVLPGPPEVSGTSVRPQSRDTSSPTSRCGSCPPRCRRGDRPTRG